MTPEAREWRIDFMCRLLAQAEDRRERVQAWNQLRRLILERDPKTVEQMERERGLR